MLENLPCDIQFSDWLVSEEEMNDPDWSPAEVARRFQGQKLWDCRLSDDGEVVFMTAEGVDEFIVEWRQNRRGVSITTERKMNLGADPCRFRSRGKLDILPPVRA